MADLHQYFSPEALENSNATHVVTGILWGANIAATFEQIVQNPEKVKDIEEKLLLVLKSSPINNETKLTKADKNKYKFESLQIQFSGDLLFEEYPQTIKGVIRAFRKLPTQIKLLNNGKGQPLVFVLYPLERMAQIFKHQLQIDRCIRDVSDFLAIRIENIFDEILAGKKRFNDFLNEIKPWKDYISHDWQQVIRYKQTEIILAELNIQRQLSTLLQNIRRGQGEESEMEELLGHFERENLCSLISIEQFLSENRHIKLKIQTLSEFNRETNLLKELTSNEDKILELYDKEIYLLNISNKWQTGDKQNSLKQLRYFKHLIDINAIQNDKKSHKYTSNAAFIVIDYDLHHDKHRAEKCCIYYVKYGIIESKDFYEYSFKNLSRNQIVLILKENSKLTEKQILNWHKAFMKEHATGELTKDGFVTELAKLYKSGNAAKYCDYIFTAADKDKNGRISFCELMSIVALTSTGNSNVEKRLRLIYDVIYKNDKGAINAGEFVKYIEVVTELAKGAEMVKTRNIKLIVKQMFRICGKNEENGELSKSEFLKCCRRDAQIYYAFLPDIPRIAQNVKNNLEDLLKNSITTFAPLKSAFYAPQSSMTKMVERNIILIGRTGSGKSTLKSMLIDPSILPDDATLSSTGKDPLFESLYVSETGTVLNVIDTPGLFDHIPSSFDRFDNETISRESEMDAAYEITEVHVICFCISVKNGIMEKDIRSINLLFKYSEEDISRNSCIILTGCESKNERQCDLIWSQLHENIMLKEILPYFKLGIFFSGSLSCNDGNYDRYLLECQFLRINEYRTKLIKLFEKEIEPIPISKISIHSMIDALLQR